MSSFLQSNSAVANTLAHVSRRSSGDDSVGNVALCVLNLDEVKWFVLPSRLFEHWGFHRSPNAHTRGVNSELGPGQLASGSGVQQVDLADLGAQKPLGLPTATG